MKDDDFDADDLENNLVDLEFEYHDYSYNDVYINQITAAQIISCMIVGLVLKFLYYLMFTKAPPFIGTDTRYFDLYPNTTIKNKANVRLVLTSMRPEHLFVKFGAYLFSAKEKIARPVPYIIRSSLHLPKTIINTSEKSKIEFSKRYRKSKLIQLAKSSVKNSKKMFFSVELQTNFKLIQRMQLQWSYVEPNTTKFINLNAVLLSFCSIVTFVCYIILVSKRKLDSEDKLVGFVGFLSIFSTNPFHSLVSEKESLQWAGPIAFSIYHATFRFTLFYLLSKPWKMFQIIFIPLLFIAYGIIESFSIFEKLNLQVFFEKPIQAIETYTKLTINSHFIYSMLMILAINSSFQHNDNLRTNKKITFSLIIIFGILETIVTQIVFPLFEIFKYSLVPLLSYQTTYLLLGYLLQYLYYSDFYILEDRPSHMYAQSIKLNS